MQIPSDNLSTGEALLIRDRDGHWHADWQNPAHVRQFDARARLRPRALIRYFEIFNDVLLLKEQLSLGPGQALLEIGCATGEFYRYLTWRYPRTEYYGLDISQPAIDEARKKYPKGRFLRSHPKQPLAGLLQALGLTRKPHVVYTKDVLHHQVDPWGFLRQLLELPQEALILRTRTREAGSTLLDPELSCQYHYQGWVPYLVFNLQELIGFIQGGFPEAELVAFRNHRVLGGRENRFLPKACYLPETGTAETAVGAFLKTGHPGRVRIEDRSEEEPASFFKRILRKAAPWNSH